jgi:hypothetical protein
MAGGATKTIFVRIQDLLSLPGTLGLDSDGLPDGTNTTGIESIVDLINSGFNYVADMIPAKSELWHTSRGVEYHDVATLNSDFADLSTLEYRVLSVSRKDTDGISRECREVTYEEYQQGLDVTSIFYNQKSFKNPIYSFDKEGAITITPDGGTVRIYTFRYFTDQDIWNERYLGNDSTADAADNWYFPQRAVYSAILKACMNILQAKISEAVQDEEDQELLNLLMAQQSSFEKLFAVELQRINVPIHLVGDGE